MARYRVGVKANLYGSVIVTAADEHEALRFAEEKVADRAHRLFARGHSGGGTINATEARPVRMSLPERRKRYGKRR